MSLIKTSSSCRKDPADKGHGGEKIRKEKM